MTQLTRRRFLQSSAAVGAILLGPQILQAADSPDFTIALISDNHLGRGGETASKAMRLAVEEINQSPAEFSVFCGDLVHQGENPQSERRYGEWLDIAKGLKKDHFAVPGNHDPDELFKKHVRKETDVVIDHKSYRFICFRDAEPNPGHDGVITADQAKWLDDRINEAKRKDLRVVLIAHIIYHDNKHPDVGWYIKKGRAEFAKLLLKPPIVAFFAGHFHCGCRGWSDNHGIHEVILPSTSWNNDRKLTTAPGFSLNDFRTGYTLVDVFGDKLVLSYKPLGQPVKERRELKL